LAVDSDPIGATVLVDGQFQGQTPLALKTLSSGEHRVQVVKDGYLDNSRVVSVLAGAARSLAVKLTPFSGRQPRAAYQVDPGAGNTSNGGGGSGKKIALIAAGVAVVGAGVYLATRDTNKAPTVTGVTANPVVGLQGAQAISFSASASDPDGDSLSFAWNFGDGATGTGATPTHTYTTSGAMNVSVDVSDGKKNATGTGSVTIRSMAGNWRGTLTASGLVFTTTLSLSQNGSAVTGSCNIGGSACSISGSASSPNRVSMTVNFPGFAPGNLSGTTSADVNSVSGTYTEPGLTGSFSITRQ
jgi:hypothetical protein